MPRISLTPLTPPPPPIIFGFVWRRIVDGIVIGFTMPINGKLMGRLRTLLLMERRMGSIMLSSLRARRRGLGSRPSSRVRDTSNSLPLPDYL